MTDFDTNVDPGHIVELLNEYNADIYDSQLKIEISPEKKKILLIKEDPATKENTLVVKLKFFDLIRDPASEEKRYRIRFTKKRGNLMDWYELF
jgi:hypothetical protein